MPISVAAFVNAQVDPELGAPSDYSMRIDAGEFGVLAVGRIMRVPRASGHEALLWTIAGQVEPDSGILLSDDA